MTRTRRKPARFIQGIPFIERRLSNGLTVIVHENRSVPTVTVDILVKVGSKHEENGKTGFAHLFEHLKFEGSLNVPGNTLNDRVTASGGYVNANTSNDRTNYYDTIPSNNLEDVLRMEADRLANLILDKERFEKEREIVKNEKSIRIDNQPYGRAFEELSRLIWDPGHPYRWTPIGDMTDLENSAVADAAAFHRKFYSPNNMILTIAGAVSAKTAFTLVQKYFGWMPRGPEPPALAVPAAPPLAQRREASLRDSKAQLTRLYMAYRIPAHGDEALALEALSAILGDGRASRLVDELEYKRRLVLSIGAYTYGLQETNILAIIAVPAPGVPPAKVEAAVHAEIKKLARRGVSQRELSQVKAQLKTDQLDQLQKMEEVAAALAAGKAFRNDPDAATSDLRAIETMRRTAPAAAAKKYLNPENAAVLIIEPENSGNAT